jgi:hypothetical protein
VQASELVWTQRLEEKSFVCDEDPTPVFQSVVKHYTDSVTNTGSLKMITKFTICYAVSSLFTKFRITRFRSYQLL